MPPCATLSTLAALLLGDRPRCPGSNPGPPATRQGAHSCKGLFASFMDAYNSPMPQFIVLILCLAVMALGGGWITVGLVLLAVVYGLGHLYVAWVLVAPLFTPRR